MDKDLFRVFLDLPIASRKEKSLHNFRHGMRGTRVYVQKAGATCALGR